MKIIPLSAALLLCSASVASARQASPQEASKSARADTHMAVEEPEKLSGVSILMPSDPNAKPPDISIAFNGKKLDYHDSSPGLSAKPDVSMPTDSAPNGG
ncbi:MAG: hypothetical protein GC153_04145 [Alphaproteobacteria bacterium]|nr:hypothetical protein [Alphaproteobacteria bacterium]